MGSCFGRMCPIGRWKRWTWHTKFYDKGSLVEFDSLMDTSPSHEEPISISSMLSFRRKKHLHQEVALELEEEALIEARREAARVARLANSQQIINPARLVFRDSTTSWPEEDNTYLNGSTAEDDTDVFIDENKLRLLTTRTYLPSHSSMMETESTVSSGYGRDWVNNNGSTPPSSVDLEWDEGGVFLPTETNGDKNSTPASNDLEWDNDFENQQIAELDQETAELITEIEKLTSEALEGTNHGYR